MELIYLHGAERPMRMGQKSIAAAAEAHLTAQQWPLVCGFGL
jgi:hypothetical protein